MRKNNLFNVLVTFALVTCLLLSSVICASANTIKSDKISNIDPTDIIAKLDSIGTKNEIIKVDDKANYIKYKNKYGIIEKITEKNQVIYNITESDIKNELIVKENGDLYVDGYLITITNEQGETRPVNLYNTSSKLTKDIPTPYGAVRWFKSPQHGTASDYNYNSGTTKEKISLGQEIRRLSQSALETIILGAFTGKIIGGVVLECVASQFLSKFKSSSSTYASVIYTKSFYKNGGVPEPGVLAEKYATKMYATSDWTGTYSSVTYYREFYY